MYARSDRLYTRQFRETTNLSVLLTLDTSASMAYPETGVSKFRYAQVVAAALAYLVSDQGHAVGLMTMDDRNLAYVPARGGRVHVRSLIARIDRLAPAGVWDAPRVLARGAQLLERRGIVIVLSDFYDAEDDTRRTMRQVAQRGHDVAMLQFLSRGEMTLPFTEHVELEDLETGDIRLIDASAAAATYRAAMSDFLDRCRGSALRDGIDYGLITTDTAPEVALREYLLKRAKRPALRSAPRGAPALSPIR